MNKKISTLMAGGFLLTSVFASAAPFQLEGDLVPVTPDATKGVVAGTYLVVLDNNDDQKVDDTDQILSVVLVNGKLVYKAYTVGNVKAGNYQAGGAPEKKENLLWDLKCLTQAPTTAYFYSLYNSEVESYLSFSANHDLLDTPSKEILNSADKGYSYFVTDNNETGTDVVTNGSRFYLSVKDARNNQLQADGNANVLLNGLTGQTLLFCEYGVVTADIDDIKLMNKTMAGEGFNLTFTGLDKHETNVIYNQKFKAFEVPSNLEVNLGDEGVTHIIPAGFYLATSYPDNLIGTSQITKTEDFLACTFLAVDPTINKKINAVKPSDGHGFEFTLVAARDMNYVEDINKDQATIQGQIYVGNACFAIEIPDFATDEEAYQFKIKNMRVLVDGKLKAFSGKYISSVTSEGKSHVVTNATGVTFKTAAGTVYNPKGLLNTEDVPAIRTLQFVSGQEKDENSEYGQYLTVGNTNGGDLSLYSTTDENVESDPLYQFIITDIDTVNHIVAFTNRQTSTTFHAILYKEKAENVFTIYATDVVNFSMAVINENDNRTVTFIDEPIAAKKVRLTPVTVEDQFATFNAADDVNGLVRFELARTAEADGKFYVNAPRDEEEVLQSGKAMVVSEEAADQFELVKVKKADNKTDEVKYIQHSYVYNRDGKKYTSLKRDTVAYNLYNIKLFAPEEEKAYYVDGTSLLIEDAGKYNRDFVIKTNTDGSVSLIYSADVDQNANYLAFNSNAKKEGDNAWATGNYYHLGNTINLAKTFMVSEPEAISLEAKPQHISIEASRGGFISMNEDKDGILAIANEATEDLTLWVDTTRSDESVPSFYITKGGNYLYYAADSLSSALVGRDKYELEDGQAKLIFKAAELVSSDTLATIVDGKEVMVAAKANAAANPKVKGGLGNFQYQIIKDEAGSDEYVIRLTDKYQYVRVINNMLTVDADKDKAARFIIESQSAPTANDEISASEVKVIAGNGQITIAGAAGKKVVVSNILGQVVANTVITSDNATIAAPQGIVVVAVEGEEAVKAIVK